MDWDTKTYVEKCHPNVTHQEIKRNYFIVSTKGEKYSSYTKGILYGKDEEWICLSVSYPTSKKKMVQPLIDYILTYMPSYVTPYVNGKEQKIRIKE